MNNPTLFVEVNDQRITILHCPQSLRWFARLRPGWESPLYEDLRVLVEDLGEASHLDAYWEDPLLRDRTKWETEAVYKGPRYGSDLDNFVEAMKAA